MKVTLELSVRPRCSWIAKSRMGDAFEIAQNFQGRIIHVNPAHVTVTFNGVVLKNAEVVEWPTPVPDLEAAKKSEPVKMRQWSLSCEEWYEK